MPDTITGVFIDPENGIATVRTIDKSLPAYYSLLRCSSIDIVSRSLGSLTVDIICDDEGLLCDTPWLSAVDNIGRGMLVGPLFVVKFDGREDVTSLSDLEVLRVLSRVHNLPTQNHPTPHPLLCGLNY